MSLAKPFRIAVFLICVFAARPASVKCQDFFVLKQTLVNSKNDDTAKVNILNALALAYLFRKPDSAINFAAKAVQLSGRLQYKYGEALGLVRMASALRASGNYPKALSLGLKARQMAEDLKTGQSRIVFEANIVLGNICMSTGNFNRARTYYYSNFGLLEKDADSLLFNKGRLYNQIAFLFLSERHYDSALFYAKKNLLYGQLKNPKDGFEQYRYGMMGTVYQKMGNSALADSFVRIGIKISIINKDENLLAQMYDVLGSNFAARGVFDSAVYYCGKSLDICREYGYTELAFFASRSLTGLYRKKGETDSTLKYMSLMIAAKDSMFNQQKMQQLQLIAFEEIERKTDIEKAKIEIRNTNRTYIFTAVLVSFIILALVLYRNYKSSKKANALLTKQKEKVEYVLDQLKATQVQLIHAEKMASLGEVTSGIAHEIQNPLNFVNNFSELNQELISELKIALKESNYHEADQLADDIKLNEEKINFHGKRADSIVKGMLQHSGKSSGAKELTNLNVLCDHFLKQAHASFSNKYQFFSAEIDTRFDNNIQMIAVVPQDIGRVLLNLLNNAFYAVYEKAKIINNAAYKPEVVVSTKSENGKQLIVVADNGAGIANKIRTKIFQPFFTTKPTGEGTGLGLSLCYEIVKAHNGEIMVESREDEGTKFTISIPA